MIQSCSKTICTVETVYVNVCSATVWLWCRRVQHKSSKCVLRKSLTLKLLELMFSHQWWMKLLCIMWMEYHSDKPHIWLSSDFAVPSALRIISGVIFFTTHKHLIELAMCWSIYQLERHFFLRSLWRETEHKVNIVFIISRQKQDSKLRWHLVKLPKSGLRKRSFWLSRCVQVAVVYKVGFYCFFKLSWVKSQHFLILLLHKNASK